MHERMVFSTTIIGGDRVDLMCLGLQLYNCWFPFLLKKQSAMAFTADCFQKTSNRLTTVVNVVRTFFNRHSG